MATATTSSTEKINSLSCLRPYQDRAIDWLLDHPRGILRLPMGAGKTVILLTAIAELLDSGAVSRVLVAAPYRVADLVWPYEAPQWAELADLGIGMAIGSPKQRERVLRAGHAITVLNHENLHKHDLSRFDLLVIDELSRLKTTSGHRHRALRKQLPGRVWGATGTLVTERLTDVYGEMRLVAPEVFGSKRSFLETWFIEDRYSHKIRPRPGALEEIAEKIAPYTFSIPPGEYEAQLPPLEQITVRVRLPREAQEQYDRLAEDYVLDELDVEAANDGVLCSKLQQIADGFIYDMDRGAHWLHTAKLDAVRELVDGLDTPVIVAYSHIEQMHQMAHRLRDAPWLGEGVSRKRARELVAAWNRGEVPVLLLHPKSAGHGLNLQHGGHTMIWAGHTWSLDDRLQTIARLLRSGQKHPVQVYDIVAANTIDERIIEVHQEKTRLMESFDAELQRHST